MPTKKKVATEPVETKKVNTFRANYASGADRLGQKLRTLGVSGEGLLSDTGARWSLPETMGNAPKEVKMANDSAWAPAQTLLEHTLGGVYSMGYPCFIGFPTLSALSQVGIIRSAVEVRSNSLTAEWGELTCNTLTGDDDVKKTSEQEAQATEQMQAEDAEKAEKDKNGAEIHSKVVKAKLKALDRTMQKHKVRQLFNTATENCGYFGGCYLFIDTGEPVEALANPLILTKQTFKSGSLKGFRMIEPYLVTPSKYNSWNPLASDYFVPQVYYVQGIPVHKSRLIIFKENQLPTLLLPAYNFMGLSMTQRMLDAVSHYTEAREAMVRMLLKCSTMVFATDMSEIFNGGVEDTMAMRIKYFAENRDLDGVAVLDKEREALQNVQMSLSGMSDIVQKTQEFLCSETRLPAVKLFGISPQGFSTGEADLQNNIENMTIVQQKLFTEPMRKVLRVLQMNLFGEIDEDIEFTFAPLNETDEGKKLQNELTKAQIDGQLIQMGVISPEDVRSRLLNDEDSGYSTLGAMPQQQMGPMGMGGDPNEMGIPPELAEQAQEEGEEELPFDGDDEDDYNQLTPEDEQKILEYIKSKQQEN